MRKKYYRLNSIFHFIGDLLSKFSLFLLAPLIIVSLNWQNLNEGVNTLIAFLVSGVISLLIGLLLKLIFNKNEIDGSASMLICGLSWIIISAIGALPYVFIIKANYLNAYFEAVSGFTTTGITVFSGLDHMPASLIFWRSLTQWIGGLGILSLFLVIIYQSGSVHHIYSAESHKISSSRPRPGLFNTLKILWGIYLSFTFLAALLYSLEGMGIFDAINHAFTTLSTGGFSPHDASLAFYAQNNYKHYKLMEYTVTFFMLMGGINFLIHFRVIRGEIKALWDNTEMRLWWKLIGVFTFLIILEHLFKTGWLQNAIDGKVENIWIKLESTFRHTIFQTVSIITTTGYGTKDIGAPFFPALAKQLFLIMMVIGGCVGSTGGGIKVLRVAVLKKLLARELFKIWAPNSASNQLNIDGEIVEDDEIHRVSSIFFYWMVLLVVGGGVTAFVTDLSPWQSFSGMFSALGNIGPSYISVSEMINIHPVAKITYILGMLLGRLEIIPVLLMFTSKAWR